MIMLCTSHAVFRGQALTTISVAARMHLSTRHLLHVTPSICVVHFSGSTANVSSATVQVPPTQPRKHFQQKLSLKNTREWWSVHLSATVSVTQTHLDVCSATSVLFASPTVNIPYLRRASGFSPCLLRCQASTTASSIAKQKP